MFERARPVFLVGAFGLLGLGFFFAYGRKEACAPGEACAVPNPRLKRFNRMMLWVSAVVVTAFAFFPSYAGLLLAENAKAIPAQGSAQLPTLTLGIKGMSCEACAVHIVKGLKSVPGVRSATVAYADKAASVSIDPDSPPSRNALTKAVKDVGYEVTSVTEVR
jgi:copper chaperone CopZ